MKSEKTSAQKIFSTSKMATLINEALVSDLEVLRKKIASRQIQGWGIILAGVIIIVVASMFAQPIIAVIGVLSLIPGIVILVKIGSETTLYKNRFKNEIIGAALSNIDPSLTLAPTNGIQEEEFIYTQLFTKEPDSYKTEDLISGKHDKTSIYFAEVHAQYKTQTQTKNGTKTEWHDIFKGIIFSADFNKHFNGTTVIRPKDLSSSIGAWFSKNIFSFGDKDLIELESEYFNKNFVTYSTDQVEGRYILTPAMMEKIAELNERSHYSISLSFINANMYIAFPLDQNYFEAPIFSSLLKPNFLSDDIAILQFMFNIATELDLNTRIWTKQ